MYGTTDGRLVGVDESRGTVLWAVKVGGALTKNQLTVAGSYALAIGSGGKLVKIHLAERRVERAFELPGRWVSGPVVAGQRVFVTVREEVAKKGSSQKKKRDLLLALELEDLQVVWEYREGGLFRGPVTSDGSAAYLPGADSKVLRFK